MRRSANLWGGLAVGISCLAVGTVIGWQLPDFSPMPTVAGEADSEADSEEAAGDADVFDVTLTAQQSMGLVVGSPELQDFTSYIRIPGIVKERPAVSNLHASSKLAGIVRRIYVDVGQSVREGDPLVDIELTGNDLAESQSVLLDANKQLEIVRSEIARIRPIAESGGVARKSLLEKQYEQKRLEAVIASKRQELLVKGLSPEQLDTIISGGTLVRTITISVPTGIRPVPAAEEVAASPRAERAERLVANFSPDPWVYSIEKLYVNLGSMTSPGAAVCDLAFHESLQMVGHAFETDLEQLIETVNAKRSVTVELGETDALRRIDDLSILYIDNHIDPASLSVRFFIELRNEVTSEGRDASGALFRSWWLRPDQRGHVLLPDQTWKDKIVLPTAAVAEDGLDYVVFRHLGRHDPIGEAAHSEFRKTAVTLLYRDREFCVLEPSTILRVGEEYAMNNAFLLQLQSSKSAEGGGHHHHHH